MNLNKYIFREYDIRGKVVNDFPPEVVESLGKGFGTFIKRGGGQEIGLSGDVRLTTPDLIEQFKTGVLSTGIGGTFDPAIHLRWLACHPNPSVRGDRPFVFNPEGGFFLLSPLPHSPSERLSRQVR